MNGTSGNGSNRGFLKGFFVVLLGGAFVVSSGMPLLASPQQSSDPNAAAPQPAAQQQPEQQAKDSSLPDEPQAQTQTPAEQQTPAPSGSAGAKAATVKGAPVAQPTGAAIAPAQQRGHHSLLVKVGLLAGAGIAVGATVALAERSPSRPAGAR
jgi:cytoskeletal protein RodZ